MSDLKRAKIRTESSVSSLDFIPAANEDILKLHPSSIVSGNAPDNGLINVSLKKVTAVNLTNAYTNLLELVNAVAGVAPQSQPSIGLVGGSRVDAARVAEAQAEVAAARAALSTPLLEIAPNTLVSELEAEMQVPAERWATRAEPEEEIYLRYSAVVLPQNGVSREVTLAVTFAAGLVAAEKPAEWDAAKALPVVPTPIAPPSPEARVGPSPEAEQAATPTAV